jgi:predicted transcriptional regulator
MAKKKYTLYLPVPLARKLDQVARDRHGGKSALVEDAVRASLEPQPHAGIEDALARRLNEINRTLATLARDQLVATETLALFVRYFLTATPPVPDSEQESAHREEALRGARRRGGPARRRGPPARGRGAADRARRPARSVCARTRSAQPYSDSQ